MVPPPFLLGDGWRRAGQTHLHLASPCHRRSLPPCSSSPRPPITAFEGDGWDPEDVTDGKRVQAVLNTPTKSVEVFPAIEFVPLLSRPLDSRVRGNDVFTCCNHYYYDETKNRFWCGYPVSPMANDKGGLPSLLIVLQIPDETALPGDSHAEAAAVASELWHCHLCREID